MDTPEIGKVPQNSPGPAVNQPESGTYGEKQANTDLQAQLPQMGKPSGGGGAPVAPDPNPVTEMAGPGPGRPDMAGGAAPPEGVPGAIFQGGPAQAPLGPPPNPVAGAANAQQGRLIVLQQLASSPDVSQTTREWASTVLKSLVG